MLFPKIITISGIDGSGKTTVAKLLKKAYEKRKVKAKICHTGAPLGTKSEPSGRMNGIIGYIAFIKDYLQIILQYFMNIGRSDVLIYDRFLYDTLVKIAYKTENPLLLNRYCRFLPIFFPVPHVAFFLSLPSSLAYERDHEHSQDYHTKKSALYQSLLQSCKLLTIDATKSSSEIVSIVENILKNSYAD